MTLLSFVGKSPVHPDPSDTSAADAIIIFNELQKEAEAEVEQHKHPRLEKLLHEDAPQLKELSEGDLMLDEKDIELEKENINPEKTPNNLATKRGMIPYARKLWITREVPYVFDHPGTMRFNSEKVKDEVLKAMSDISRDSCIKFRPQNANDKQWLKIFRGSGCYSSIGRKYYKVGSTDLSLGNNCVSESIILHELFHALGFFHEQSRPDRDSFVTIDFSKVNSRMTSNFDKHESYEADVQETPYDYSSLMHYGKTAFSIDGSQTIYSKFNDNQQFGRDGLSPNDIKELKKMYSCHIASDWSEWGEWTPCFTDWRRGCITTKQRFCISFTSNPSACKEADEFGVEEKHKKCNKSECDVKGLEPHWGAWGEYGTCSLACGEGYHSRERQCDNPPPDKPGKKCVGHAVHTSLCRLSRCVPENFPYDADFERGFEPWYQDKTKPLQWQITRGTTPNTNSGPKSSFLTAQYAYISATDASQSGRRGWLISKTIPANKGPVCVSFYYNMNGKQMGKLNFLVRKSGKLWLYWQKDGLQSVDWKQGAFSIRKQNVSYEIIAAGKLGTAPDTDIAIDDIRVNNGLCIKGSQGCKDYNQFCSKWKYYGECYKNYGWMLRSCCETCHSMDECDNVFDMENNVNKCTEWANKGECVTNKLWMWKNCCKACRECADIESFRCLIWSKAGWCEKSNWMMENCKTSCSVCKS